VAAEPSLDALARLPTAGASAALVRLRRWLGCRATRSGPPTCARSAPGALAGGSLLLCRSERAASHMAASAPCGRLLPRGDRPAADRGSANTGGAVWGGAAACAGMGGAASQDGRSTPHLGRLTWDALPGTPQPRPLVRATLLLAG